MTPEITLPQDTHLELATYYHELLSRLEDDTILPFMESGQEYHLGEVILDGYSRRGD